MMEEISQAAQFFLPIAAPEWPTAEMGLAKNLPPMSPLIYQQFWKLANNHALTIIAIPKDGWIESGFSASIFAGMCQGVVSMMIASEPKTFKPLLLIQKLNDLLLQNFPKVSYHVAVLHLDPFQDLATYIPCGFSELLHIPQGTHSIRKLGIDNPPLGTDKSDRFTSTSNNWDVGDSLILHTLMSPGKEGSDTLLKALEEAVFFSAQHQAETLLKKTAASFSSAKEARLFLSIQRIY